MAKCEIHPKSEAELTLYGKGYRKKCQAAIDAARKQVSKHVEPKACFIWFTGKNGWEPIDGTGCAHWVSHQQDIRKGGTSVQCLAGYTYRVKTMIAGMKEVRPEDVKVGDIYVTPKKDHTGIVIKVDKSDGQGTPNITIEHDSSGQGKVAVNDFKKRFKGRGSFLR